MKYDADVMSLASAPANGPIPTLPEYIEDAAANLADHLAGEAPERDAANEHLTGLVAEACGELPASGKPLTQRAADHLTAVAALLESSRRFRADGDMQAANREVAAAEIFIAYLMHDLAAIDQLLTWYELGPPSA